MRTVDSPAPGTQGQAHIFAEGAVALHIDEAGTVVAVDRLDGTPSAPNHLSPIPLRQLLLAESVESALDDVREVLATGSARFVSWKVAVNGEDMLHAGWLYPEDGQVVGVLRCFETPA